MTPTAPLLAHRGGRGAERLLYGPLFPDTDPELAPVWPAVNRPAG
jgi:hypothetical protein